MMIRAENKYEELSKADPAVLEAVQSEERRQHEKLELIASENYTSPAVLEAAGTVLTNKYAEGYPGKRFYGGCECVDVVEDLARDRARDLFSAEYANVQPHSGSNANMAVYMTVMNPGDTILGMDLSHGGHLTHGAKVNFSGQLYRAVTYGVNRETERIDYDEVAEIARREKPKVIVAGASAYPRVLDFARFRAIADEVGAYLVVDMAHIAGLVAAGEHPSPLPHAHFTTTTTHKTLRGPRGGLILMGSDGENDLGIVAKKSGRTKRWSELVDATVMPGIQGGPLMHIVAAKAVAFHQALRPSFAQYQKRVIANAQTLGDVFAEGGARIVSGGTDNHLLLMDVTPFGISGKRAEQLLDEAGITANKNGIPFDTKGPLVTSGIRIGTPAVTTRGMGQDEMKTIGGHILEVLRSDGDEEILRRVNKDVKALCAAYPLYRDE